MSEITGRFMPATGTSSTTVMRRTEVVQTHPPIQGPVLPPPAIVKAHADWLDLEQIRG